MSEGQRPDGWTTGSGLALDSADVEITAAVYTFDASYNDGKTLVCKMELKDEESGEDIEQFFPCGDGWEAKDKGKRAEHEKGPRKAIFNKNSAMGRLIDSAFESGAGDVLLERGTGLDADVWVGLRFHMETEEQTFKFRDGTERTTGRVICKKFLGVAGDDDKKKSTAKKPAKSEPKPDAEDADAGEGGGDDKGSDAGIAAPLRAKLTATAKSAKSHDDFMEKAFGLDGVMGNDAAEQAVMDASDDGLFAKANA